VFGEREVYVPRNAVGRLRANAEIHSQAECELLAEELTELNGQLEEISKERDRLREAKSQCSPESVRSLKEENVRLRTEVGSMYALLDEVNELKARLREGVGAYASEVYEENLRLKKQVEELENHYKESSTQRRPYTSSGPRPMTALVRADEMASDEVYELTEKNNRMRINVERKVAPYKADHPKNGK
jgi:chromosome segregation ATPase